MKEKTRYLDNVFAAHLIFIYCRFFAGFALWKTYSDNSYNLFKVKCIEWLLYEWNTSPKKAI